jgi:hypothetical protein
MAKLNQIAISVKDQEKAKIILNDIFGATFPMYDGLFMSGFANGKPVTDMEIDLSFSFDLCSQNMEFEYITKKDDQHWHLGNQYLSHLGVYCESKDELESICNSLKHRGYTTIQDTISENHSRKNSDGSERHYIDVIFDTKGDIGFNIKLSLKVNQSDCI